MSVRVVTDSSAVIPGAWTAELPLHIVPLQLAWPDGSGTQDRPYSELSKVLRKGQAPPKTSAPSPGAYEELYRDLLEVDDAVLVVCPATELSTTYASAVLAARSVGEDRAVVLDARTAAAGQGLVAIEAARAARDGGDTHGVLARALRAAETVQIWATLTQLDFLRRSGRVPAVAAIGAGALRLQPVVRYSGGSPTPVGVTRSAQRGTDRLWRAWQRSVSAGASVRAVAFHCERAAEAEDLRARILQHTSSAQTAVVEVMASLASHTGPGLLGLAWLWGP